MDAIEPLISSATAGPLGIAHLPRLWLKILLHAAGKLPEGYRFGEGGFDGGLFTQFGLDGAAFVTFVRTEFPDYLALEKWVVANANDLSPYKIALWNTHVRSANLPAERSALWRERFGIADDTFGNGTALNDLDDWACFHDRLAATKPA